MKITKGNVFDDLGFDAERSLELKIKADIMLRSVNTPKDGNIRRLNWRPY